ncbi:hypothetical protein J2X73_004632 [Novosphingobium sp. 1748]|nr:hypothetical protein [Novosphingobium sp. 1748]
MPSLLKVYPNRTSDYEARSAAVNDRSSSSPCDHELRNVSGVLIGS